MRIRRLVRAGGVHTIFLASLPIFPILLLSWVSAADHAGTGQVMLDRDRAAAILGEYFEQMSVPKPFEVRTGLALRQHADELRKRLLGDLALDPLPERIPLDVHESAAIDHPWCTIKKVAYQIWPDIYSRGLLYLPKDPGQQPAPVLLSTTGHWPGTYCYAEEQKRALMFARLGYVVFAPPQNHEENPNLGLSHQTHMIWSNMRALDYLESLPEVDKGRIGVAGASGGGLQAQMLAALDPRIKAASIVGFTCDFREIMFSYAAHCDCNHFPGVMAYTDHPEISALAYPAAVQYLTMDDWSGHFRYHNFPTVLALYSSEGAPERVDCVYWPTPHVYERQKRERTYWWMEKWVRGKSDASIPQEVDEIQTIPSETLAGWPVDVPNDKGLGHLQDLFREQYRFQAPAIGNRAEWNDYRVWMCENLGRLLGQDKRLALQCKDVETVSSEEESGVRIERMLIPSEGGVRIPIIVFRSPLRSSEHLPVELVLRERGTAFDRDDWDEILAKARTGRQVVVLEIRFTGAYSLKNLAGAISPSQRCFKAACETRVAEKPEDQAKQLHRAWERNSIVWGRPLLGMMATDIEAVLDGLTQRSGEDAWNVRITTSGPAFLGVAAVFAAVLDPRIRALEIDFDGSRFEHAPAWCDAPDGLPAVPFVLRFGGVPQWVALLADREVVLHNADPLAADWAWSKGLFSLLDNGGGLRIIGR